MRPNTFSLFPRRSNRAQHLSPLRFRWIGDCRQDIHRYTSPRKSHETTALSEDQLGTVGGISKKDIVEDGNQQSGLLVAAYSVFLIMHVSTRNRLPQGLPQCVDLVEAIIQLLTSSFLKE
jgi:hypothetical protein